MAEIKPQYWTDESGNYLGHITSKELSLWLEKDHDQIVKLIQETFDPEDTRCDSSRDEYILNCEQAMRIVAKYDENKMYALFYNHHYQKFTSISLNAIYELCVPRSLR